MFVPNIVTTIIIVGILRGKIHFGKLSIYLYVYMCMYEYLWLYNPFLDVGRDSLYGGSARRKPAVYTKINSNTQ
jgi:hypothetical protein